MHPEPIVIDETINESTRDLARKAAKAFSWTTVRVRPLSRFGYSGARIFVIRPDHVPHVPHVLKIAPRRQIDAEMKAIMACDANIKDMPVIKKFTTPRTESDGRQLSAIAYAYYTGSDSEAPVDLTDVYARCLNSPTPAQTPETFDSRLAGLLTGALNLLKTAHVPLPAQSGSTYRKALNWYLRDARESRVGRVLGGSLPVQIHGVDVSRDLVDKRNVLLRERTTGFDSVVVHGDLHLSNVVIDGSATPKLIDFAWARSGGHIFLDYVLLESSLRFMSFPHDVSPSAVRSVDMELNTHRDGGAAAGLAASAEHSLTRHRLEQMVAAVCFVRNAAGQVMGGWDDRTWTEYKRVLYLVLTGQERLDTFPLMRTIVNLHQLSDELAL